MRILVTGRGFDTPSAHSLGIFEWDQARALRDAGHDVRFAALDTRFLRHLRPLGYRRYTLDGLPVCYCAIPAGAFSETVSGWAQRRAGDAIWKNLLSDGWRPDVIHAHFGSGFLAAAKREGIPFVYTEHSSAANAAHPSEAELRWERETYAYADALICVSGKLAERLAGRWGVRARVIPNIVDTELFAFSGVREEREPFRFVSTGNLIPGKGFDTLLRALSVLGQRRVRPELTVVGQGPEETALKRLSAQLGLEAQTAFVGYMPRPSLPELYRRADAFVLSSRGETFGVAYIEAMAAGLPVIATRCGGPEDFVTEENGLLVPPDDPEALAEAMERVMERRDDYDGARISAAARERYAPARIAAELTAVYEEVLSCGSCISPM